MQEWSKDAITLPATTTTDYLSSVPSSCTFQLSFFDTTCNDECKLLQSGAVPTQSTFEKPHPAIVSGSGKRKKRENLSPKGSKRVHHLQIPHGELNCIEITNTPCISHPPHTPIHCGNCATKCRKLSSIRHTES